MIATLPISSGLALPHELPFKAIAIESLTGAIAIGNAVDAYTPLPLLACAGINSGPGVGEMPQQTDSASGQIFCPAPIRMRQRRRSGYR